ncbi:MAG: zf-HC2 domain-containing protein [Jatrophihabitantaceae bacterium]
MLDPFAHDDGAYVLGALHADEQAAFERHLRTCSACTERVGDLAPLPALLAALPASAYDAAPDAPAAVLAQLLRQVHAVRRRRHWITAGLGGLAAACLIALAVVLWPAGRPDSPGTGAASAQAMSAVNGYIPSSLHATATLTGLSWGTQITLACRYDAPETPGGSYQLVVFDRSNVAHPAGSWKLIPGKVTHFTGGAAVTRDQISSVAIAIGDRVILQLTL